MKTRTLFLGAAIAAVLNCTAVNAQVLGGNVAGGLGGTLSGGMRDTSVLTRGNGDLGADIDTGGLRRTTRDTMGRTTDRVRDTAGATRNRAESTVGKVRNKSANVATSAAANATQSVNTQQLDAASGVTGAAASNVAANGTNVAEGNGTSATQVTDAVKSNQPSVSDEAPRSLNVGGALDGSSSSNSTLDRAADKAPLSVSHDAEGSASGEASASKKGVSAGSSADGRGSADVSTKR